MFQLRRIGFYFYTAAQILMLFVLPYFAGFNFMVLAGMLFSAIFAVIFIVMYAFNLKYMRCTGKYENRRVCHTKIIARR